MDVHVDACLDLGKWPLCRPSLGISLIAHDANKELKSGSLALPLPTREGVAAALPFT